MSCISVVHTPDIFDTQSIICCLLESEHSLKYSRIFLIFFSGNYTVVKLRKVHDKLSEKIISQRDSAGSKENGYLRVSG